MEPNGGDRDAAPSQFNYFHFYAVFSKNLAKQECIPVECVTPAAVAAPGGLHQAPQEQAPPFDQAPPQSRPPWDQAPPGAHPPEHKPPESTPSPLTESDTCKIITLPQLQCGQ